MVTKFQVKDIRKIMHMAITVLFPVLNNSELALYLQLHIADFIVSDVYANTVLQM